jgi:hypothetical protein
MAAPLSAIHRERGDFKFDASGHLRRKGGARAFEEPSSGAGSFMPIDAQALDDLKSRLEGEMATGSRPDRPAYLLPPVRSA